jgi:large subunit ribosomal protein L9
MKVVLMTAVPKLGERWDVCDVADGYARNFLFPQKLAVLATPQVAADAERERAEIRKKAERELANVQQLASRLDGFELETTEKVSEGGVLYASVGSQKVAQLLQSRGFPIKKTQIAVEPIKTPGEYPATIRFDHGLEVEISVIVCGANTYSL